MSIDNLARAFASTREVLAATNASHYDLPTPCASWNVRALANHIVEGSNWFALCVNAGAAPDPDPTKGVDYAADDLLAAYDRGVAASLSAFGAPGSLDKAVALPFGTMPAAAFLGLATNDVVVHGWDLARAIGQPAAIDDDLATALLPQMQAAVPPEFRGPDGQAPFGPEQSAPTGASAGDRLAAFLGRRL